MGYKKNGTVDMKYYESKEILDRIEPIRAAIAQALTLSPDKVPIFFSFLLSFFFFFFLFFFFLFFLESRYWNGISHKVRCLCV